MGIKALPKKNSKILYLERKTFVKKLKMKIKERGLFFLEVFFWFWRN
jgi:hypothetical protein